MLRLTALYRYPLKSAMAEPLRGSSVDSLGLTGDRRWMVVDEASGRFLTQRVLPVMSRLSVVEDSLGGLILKAAGRAPLPVTLPNAQAQARAVIIWRDTLRVPDAGDAAAAWLSELFGKPVRLVYLPAQHARPLQSGYGQEQDRVAFADGFPLLLISQASVDELSARIGRPQHMLRFRPNLVIEGAEPFAEDGWERIRVGELEFRVVKPCARCIMTTIDPLTGERDADREPLTTLKRYRARDGDILFGQNLISDGAGQLEVGMPVTVL